MAVGHDHGSEEDALSAFFEPEYTKDLRIAAVFIIFAASLLGSVSPLFARRATDGALGFLLRSFSAGVILSVAIVHIYHEAEDQLHDVVKFPLAGTCIVFGVLLLVLIELGLNTFLAAYLSRSHADAHDEEEAKQDVEPAIEKEGSDDGHSHGHGHGHVHGHACTAHASSASWFRSAIAAPGTLRQQVSAATCGGRCEAATGLP